jgi:hypothetical protein
MNIKGLDRGQNIFTGNQWLASIEEFSPATIHLLYDCGTSESDFNNCRKQHSKGTIEKVETIFRG